MKIVKKLLAGILTIGMLASSVVAFANSAAPTVTTKFLNREEAASYSMLNLLDFYETNGVSKGYILGILEVSFSGFDETQVFEMLNLKLQVPNNVYVWAKGSTMMDSAFKPRKATADSMKSAAVVASLYSIVSDFSSCNLQTQSSTDAYQQFSMTVLGKSHNEINNDKLFFAFVAANETAAAEYQPKTGDFCVPEVFYGYKGGAQQAPTVVNWYDGQGSDTPGVKTDNSVDDDTRPQVNGHYVKYWSFTAYPVANFKNGVVTATLTNLTDTTKDPITREIILGTAKDDAEKEKWDAGEGSVDFNIYTLLDSADTEVHLALTQRTN